MSLSALTDITKRKPWLNIRAEGSQVDGDSLVNGNTFVEGKALVQEDLQVHSNITLINSSFAPSNSIVQKWMKRIITQAEIVAMSATPIQLIAAPDAGHVLMITNMFWSNAAGGLTAGTDTYVGGGNVVVQWGNTALGLGASAISANDIAPSLSVNTTSPGVAHIAGRQVVSPTTLTNSFNLGIFLTNKTAPFTAPAGGLATGNQMYIQLIYYDVSW